MKSYYWAGWDYGKVQHAWKSNRFNKNYRSSACGMSAHWDRLINNDARHCKNCERAIKAEDKEK